MTSATQVWAEDAREQQRQQVEAELDHVQCSTELSHAIATLVHEAHEPLTAISNYANACRRLVTAGNQDDVPTMLERIAEQIERAGEMLHRIRELVMTVDPTIES